MLSINQLYLWTLCILLENRKDLNIFKLFFKIIQKYNLNNERSIILVDLIYLYYSMPIIFSYVYYNILSIKPWFSIICYFISYLPIDCFLDRNLPKP